MFIRFNRDYDTPGRLYEQGEVIDLDRTLAQRFINDGAATLVLTDPGQFRPDAVAITGGTINGTSIGATTRSTGNFTSLNISLTDSTGTPGNVSNAAFNGRAAFAVGQSTCTVTSANVTTATNVFVQLLGAADATLTSIVGVTVNAGSFTVTGNAAATAAKSFMFLVINP